MIFLPIFNESTEKALKKIKIFDNLPFLLPIYQQSREEKRGGGVNWKGAINGENTVFIH